MSIDPYTICPGGCNKKIKFCCGKDVSVHLDKIVNSLSGEQRLAALDQTNAAIKQFGEKPCLLTLKTNILFQLDEWDQAGQIAESFLKQYPTNPVALAMGTIIRLHQPDIEKLDEVVEQLQRCLENIDQVATAAVLEAIRRVGIVLLHAGRITAARAHLSLYNSFLESPHPEISSLIMRTVSPPDIPLLLKEEHPLTLCNAEVPWAEEFNQIMGWTQVGKWLSAVEELSDLDKKYPGQPLIAKSIAILESRLGDPAEMAAAWSQYADTEGVPLQDAVEAEALSQLVDPTIDANGIEIVDTVYPVTNVESLLAKLATNKRFHKVQADLSRFTEDGPPPKAAYLFLDKPALESSENLTAEQIPNVIGQILVYGKQTDRGARISLGTARDEGFDERTESLFELLGDDIGREQESQEVIDEVARVTHAMTWNWHFPQDTPREVRQKLIEERRQQILFDVWPDLPLDELDGKTPRQAAPKPYYKVPLLGAILLLELSESVEAASRIDLNPLRKELGLPARESVDPTQHDIKSVSLVQLEALQIDKLTDEQLVEVMRTASVFNVSFVLREAGKEILSRESFKDHDDVDLSHVHQILAQLEPDTDQALQHIRKARDITIDRGDPVGLMLVAEFAIRMQRGVIDQCQSLLREIESRHMREPGVSQELMRVLMRFGIIGPDGRPRAKPTHQVEELLESEASASSKIWTPDSSTAASSTGEKKLWIPGVD